MKQISDNVFVDNERRGSNHGYVTTSDGIVLIDTPHKPTDALRLRAEIEAIGPVRYIINTEPHGDHWTGNAYFDAPPSPTPASGSASSTPTWPSTSSACPAWAPTNTYTCRATRPTRPSSPSRAA